MRMDPLSCAHINAMEGASGHTICLDCGTSLDAPDKDSVHQRRAEIAALPTSTTPELPGHEIERSLGVVGAQQVHGVGIGRDVLASFSNTFGGRSSTLERGLSEARDRVLYELKAQAQALGATALVGVAFDQQLISGASGSASMLMVTGTGTAVHLKSPPSQ
jgi:uncharacterized protein YbjQ (UPF0145 family)